jgi:predicted GIY-YIG superfamily endonuclease
MKSINLKAIRIDGGTHRNYVVEFADGSCKVGVTANPRRRLRELERKRGKSAVRVMLTPAIERAIAFELERSVCRLTRHSVIPGSREWHQAKEHGFDYLHQTTGMFWHLIARVPYAPEVHSL